MRLFIIGNGFDIDHGLKTKFKHFKEFLEQTYLPTFNREFVPFPDVGVGRNGEIIVNPNTASQILYSLISRISISSEWKDFEECLGKLDYQEVLDYVEADEEKPFNYYNNLEDIVESLESSLIYVVSRIFCDWISGIETSNVKAKYAFLDDDMFLTFNYTDVLENVYVK